MESERKTASKVAGFTVALLLFCLGTACGSDPEEKKNGTPCTSESDCPGGSCQGGKCTYFSNPDAKVGDAFVQPADSDSTSDQRQQVDADDTTATDSAHPADVHEPGDATGVKPPAGSPDIFVDPTQHMFTYVPGVNVVATKTVDIYNESAAKLTISKIYWQEGSSPEFSFLGVPGMPKELGPYGHTAVIVKFKEQAPHKPAYLIIESDDPDESVVTVEFTSQSKIGDQPCIELKPSSLNFGQVQRGDTKAMSFEIVNCSDKLPLLIKEVKRDKGFFGMALTQEFQFAPPLPTPFNLPPNQAMPQTVTYSPGLAGPDNGNFIIVNDDPTAPETKLYVQGVGIPPPLEEIGLHIELEWDSNYTDVDMHLLAPLNGKFFDCDTDCYFANMSPDWGAKGSYLDDPFLDYDDVDGYGPEHINLQEPVAGVYKLMIHYYNDSYEGYSGGASKATVRIYSYGNLVQQFGPQNLSHTNMTWDVCNITWPGPGIAPLGNVYDIGSTPGSACLPWF